MEFICGAADFSSEQKFNPPKNFYGLNKTVYSDNQAILCRFFEDNTKTAFSADGSFAEISIDDTYISYDPALQKLHFLCGKSGLHRLFFTFVGSAFIFSTDLSLLVQKDDKPNIFMGDRIFSNISEVKRGKCGTFSTEGLKFY